jgi:hypothetical protein
MAFSKFGYTPYLPTWQGIAPPAHPQLDLEPFNPKMKRPKFYESTINAVYGSDPTRTVTTDLSGRIEVKWQCQCKTWAGYEGMTIDHIVKWRDYLADVGPGTAGDAWRAYNDCNNLRLLCAVCNSSGDENDV